MYTQDGDSKYVANILSNMANGGDRAVQVTVSCSFFFLRCKFIFRLNLTGVGVHLSPCPFCSSRCHFSPHPDT